jgi:hypothetical protein
MAPVEIVYIPKFLINKAEIHSQSFSSKQQQWSLNNKGSILQGNEKILMKIYKIHVKLLKYQFEFTKLFSCRQINVKDTSTPLNMVHFGTGLSDAAWYISHGIWSMSYIYR